MGVHFQAVRDQAWADALRRPGGAEIDSMFRRVYEVQAAVHQLSPELGSAEDDWFAAGMHESPFAGPMPAGPVPHPEER